MSRYSGFAGARAVLSRRYDRSASAVERDQPRPGRDRHSKDGAIGIVLSIRIHEQQELSFRLLRNFFAAVVIGELFAGAGLMISDLFGVYESIERYFFSSDGSDLIVGGSISGVLLGGRFRSDVWDEPASRPRLDRCAREGAERVSTRERRLGCAL